MRRIKALPLFIAVALVGAALAVPASATAVEWKGGNLLSGEPGPIEFNGPVTWENGVSGLRCQVHAAGTLYPGNKGEITAFDVDGNGEHGSAGCVTFGTYANCAVKGATFTKVPPKLEAKSTNEALITQPITKVLWTWTFSQDGGLCGPSNSVDGQLWKIRSDLVVGVLYTSGAISSFGESSLSPVEIIKYNKKGEQIAITNVTLTKIGWAVPLFPSYYIS